MRELPVRIAALCPTYRRPKLLANLLDCWEAQDYTAELRRLFILDDGGTFAAQNEETWELHAASSRYPSLPAKYNALVAIANRWEPDAYVVMEDDDLYLPRYVSSHATVLADAEYSKPSVVLSDYPGRIVEERAAGRFHGSIGFRRSLCERIGGWPATRRADFDQQMLARLRDHAETTGDPCALALPQYLFRWHTGHWHGQHAMRGPDDEGWYEVVGKQIALSMPTA